MRKSIFEEVQFFNEGVGTFLLGSLLLAGGIYATVDCVKETINDSKDKKMIKSALKNARNNKEIAEIDGRIRQIKVFSKEDFLKQDFITDEDRYKLKATPVAIYCAIDNDNKIIAYSIYDGRSSTYLFNTVKNGYSKEVIEYLKVLFEYRMGLKGEATKNFLKITKFNNPYRFLGIDKPNPQSTNYDDLTDEEKHQIQKDLKLICDNFVKFAKSKFPGYRIEVNNNDYDLSVHIYDKNEPVLRDGTIRNDKAYNMYYSSDAPQKFLDKADDLLKDFINKYKLHGGDRTAIGTKDNYPYIVINRNDNPDDFLTADFDILTTFDEYY